MRHGPACWPAILPLGLCAALGAQEDDKLPKWKIDPYTKNNPKLMAKAGYVSYGPFIFGDDHTSEDVENFLGEDKLIWVETKHFRFGCSLEEWRVPEEADTKAKLRQELERLQEFFPSINPRVRRLDPWLRLHLYAMRIEDCYALFLKLIQKEEQDFPPDPEKVVRGPKFMGYGPYLGQKEKYLLLLTQKASSYGAYLNRFVGKQYIMSQRWNFKVRDSLFFGTAAEIDDGRLRHDTALHCHTAFNIAINMTDGYLHYSYDLPVWFREGIGHYFERLVSPNYNSFDQDEGSLADLRNKTRWEPDVRRFAFSGKFTPFSKMAQWRHYGDIKFDDHMQVWSRLDFLIAHDREKFAQLFYDIKSKVDPNTWHPDPSNIVEHLRDAMMQIYGWGAMQFDDQWKEWVIANYPLK